MTLTAQKKLVKQLTGKELIYKTDDVGHGEQRGWWNGAKFVGQRDAIDYYIDDLQEVGK